MAFTSALKPTKDMTDDELYNEFSFLQKIARQNGQNLPLMLANPGTVRSRTGTPPFDRGTVQQQLDIFRRDLDTNDDLQKAYGSQMPESSYSNGSRLAQQGKPPQRKAGPLNRFIRGLESILEYDRGKREAFDKNYGCYADQGMTEFAFREQHYKNFIRIHGPEKGEKEYQKALEAFRRAKKERASNR